MKIRRAEEKDIPRMMELLGQVLQIHAEIRPDIFIPGTTKYTVDELAVLLKNKEKPIYVAVDGEDVCRIRVLPEEGTAFFKQYGAVQVPLYR